MTGAVTIRDMESIPVSLENGAAKRDIRAWRGAGAPPFGS